MDNQTYSKIDSILQSAKGDLLNMSWYVYTIIKDSDTPEKGLQYFYETYYDSIDSSEETILETHFSEDDSRCLKEQFGKLIDAMLENTQSRNLLEEEFYAELWNQVINCSFFPTDDQRAFALYYIWIDKRIPYYHLADGKHMSNEIYRQYTAELSNEIKKMLYILNTSTLSQKTERASLLLEILEGIDLEDKKVVFLSQLISELNTKNRFSELSELIRRLPQ